ncbi:MAG: hypothetical protein M5Z89_10915 [Olivibacter sp.]|nr:hypothetical protein [Olivibacter sp. UJ_SKK_5.1]
MAKIVKATLIQQYNIDKIKESRLALEVSGPELSNRIGKSATYVNQAESAGSDLFYSDEVMNRIAAVLTEEAKEKQKIITQLKSKEKIKITYSIHDFYPKKPLEDKLIVKTSVPIPKGVGPSVTLNAIIETEDFFDRERTLKEIVSYCNKFDNKNWKESDFTATLERAVGKGKLKKYYDQEEKVFYIKSNSK